MSNLPRIGRHPYDPQWAHEHVYLGEGRTIVRVKWWAYPVFLVIQTWRLLTAEA